MGKSARKETQEEERGKRRMMMMSFLCILYLSIEILYVNVINIVPFRSPFYRLSTMTFILLHSTTTH